MNDSASRDSVLIAPAYGLLLGHIRCHSCHSQTPTTALWVSSFVETDEEGVVDQGDGALLHYIEHLDEGTAAFVRGQAPWLRLASTCTSCQIYHAHHCTTCGAIQGDHFVFSPDGPYWPQDDVDMSRLRLIEGPGELIARASAGQSAWMDRVMHVCSRE